MRLVFMGSPEFAVPALDRLRHEHEIALVVTQPDKRAGRGKKLAAPAVKVAAEAVDLPVDQPQSAREPAFAERLRAVGADAAVVVAYGKILPTAVLEAFSHGCFNIHGSLLPKYRGAAPIQWAVIDGEEVTGVTIMRLDEGMDTGPILRVAQEPIRLDDTAGSLFERLAPVGADAMAATLRDLERGKVVETPQDDALASHARMLEKNDGRVDWSKGARAVSCLIRGVDPWPGAFVEGEGGRIKLFGAAVCDGEGEPGTIARLEHKLEVACGERACEIGQIQAPGKRRVTAIEYARSRGLNVGERLV